MMSSPATYRIPLSSVVGALLALTVPRPVTAQVTPPTTTPASGPTGQNTTPPPLPTAPETPATTPEAQAAQQALEQARLFQRKPEGLPLDRLKQMDAKKALDTAADLRNGTPPEERNRVFYSADEAHGVGATETAVLSGNVRIRYNGYTVTCDRATFHRKTNLLTFEGNVVLTTGRRTVGADFVEINTKTNEFLARGGRTIVPPDDIGNQIVQPVFLSGQTLKREGGIYEATYGLFTTCDFPNPHYKIGFRQATLIPNDRIVFRDAVIYRYDRVIARVPYLSIPVREDIRYSYLPYVGHTQEEGWFLKVILGYSLSKTLPGLLRIDLMEKKGIGLGFDQAYRFADRSAGTLSLYNLDDKSHNVRDFHGRLNHQQLIGDVNATLATDFQNNSYQSLTPSSNTSQTNLTLNRAAGGRTTNITSSFNLSDYGTSKSNTTTFAISETERLHALGSNGSITLRFNGTDSTNTSVVGTTTNISGRDEQTGDLKATGQTGIFDIDLAANKNFLLHQKGTATGIAFSGTQRLPDFKMTTDTKRLQGFFARLPARLSFGFGRFLETIASTTSGSATPQDITTNRLLFQVTPETKRVKLTPGGWLSATLDGDFLQTIYRQDAAQYVLTARSSLTQKLGTDSNLNFTYNYLRPYGGTPPDFRLDQVGSTNNVGANLQVNSYRTKLSLITGYDIMRANADLGQGIPKNPWQNLQAQLAFRPSPILQTRFTFTHDINANRLLDATNRTRIRGRNNFALDTGLRYDPRTKKFPQMTEALTVPLFSRDATFTATTGYNGQTKKFDYKQFSLVRAFHDYDLVFGYINQPYGFRTEQGFNFTVRLRALPTVRPQATGGFGTPIDAGGEVF